MNIDKKKKRGIKQTEVKTCNKGKEKRTCVRKKNE